MRRNLPSAGEQGTILKVGRPQRAYQVFGESSSTIPSKFKVKCSCAVRKRLAFREKEGFAVVDELVHRGIEKNQVLEAIDVGAADVLPERVGSVDANK